MSSKYPPCADCGHEIGVHDPCSLCHGKGKVCRTYTTTKSGKRPYAETRRGKQKGRRR